MRLSLSTDSNPVLQNLFLSSEDPLCPKARLLQKRALSVLRSLSLVPKPADGLIQRVWKVLPYISNMIYKVVSYAFPFMSYYWIGYFQALDLLNDPRSFTEREKKLLSEFLLALNSNSELFPVLRAFANTNQYRMLLFLQGIFLGGDAKMVKSKLDNILLGKICPLTAEELGIIQYSSMRADFLRQLQQQNITGIDSSLAFWSEMEKIGQHPVIETFRKRTLALFSEGCLGFISSYEDDKRMEFNLREDSIRLMNLATIAYYLFVGNFCHVGFAFAKEGKVHISDISLHHRNRHAVRPSTIDILHPSHFLYRFTIKPLLSSKVSADHVEVLQKFFLDDLTQKVSIEQNLQLHGATAALQALFLGYKAPFWDQKTGLHLQKKEFCTGVTAKTLVQSLLATQGKLQELGYSADDLVSPFLPHEHIGRLMVSDLIGRLQKKGMIEPVVDPVLKVCIEPGYLEAELPFTKLA